MGLVHAPLIVSVVDSVVLIVVMLILMVCSVNLSTAYKKGEMTRESCGMEYLEAETERREIQLAWEGDNGVKKIFTAGLAIFLAIAGIGLVILCIDIFMTSLKKDGNSNNIYKWSSTRPALILSSFLILSSLGTLQAMAILLINGKWWDTTTTDLNAYIKQKMYAPLITVIGTAGIAIILGLVTIGQVETQANIVQEWVLAAITLGVLIFLIPLLKQYTYFKFYIEDYKKKGEAVMTAIGKVDGQVAQYIKQNKADYGETAGEDFLYIMHRDGKEGEFLPVQELGKELLTPIKDSVKILLTDLVVDSTLRDSLYANFTTNIATASTDLAGNLTIARERLKEVVIQSLGADVVKICSLVKLGRENPACDGRALLKNALGAHLRWIQTNSEGKGLTYGAWKAKIADFIDSNVLIDSDTIIPRDNAKTVAREALEKDAKAANNDRDVGDGDTVAARTIEGLVAKLTSATGLTAQTQFNQAVLGKSIAEFLNEKVDEMLDIVKSESDKRVAL
ncbi:MAG: hypothetical protein ACO222_05430, partial [Polynucleobacter sp.]